MTESPPGMTSNRPYLLRALYEWIMDNSMTPHVLVNAEIDGVDVPENTIQKGKVVLNIASSATEQMQMGNNAIEFKARFSGKPYPIYIPMEAVIAIYARENGQGMMFAQDEDPEPPPVNDPDDRPSRSHLKVVK
ncbi:MAG: ClpXP protease specificity-enhancing factor [Xanthomonadales bacterium]|nr:ClpXP protease specificity-enhancing factor [Xanthomonadales bacterium]